MRILHKKALWGIGLAGAVVVGACVAAMALVPARSPIHLEAGIADGATPDPREGEQSQISVNTVRPRRDPSFEITVEQPAYVEAYYKADLQSRVAGVVKFLQKAIGDPVTKEELLAQIDVPDLDQEVLEKEATVRQRQKELGVARAKAKIAEAAVEVARSEIKQKDTDVEVARATRLFRKKELGRFTELTRGPSPGATPAMVDEREQYYLAAEAGLHSAQVAVEKAKSDLAEYQAKLDAARADVELKQVLVEVARKDQDRVQALANYAKITAPFDGVITRRAVDPGSFVQDAATGHPDPLLTVERTDIVTVYMKVPDNYAPYVTRNTEAVIEMSEVAGQLIHGKVTRFTPSLQTPANDRTMRIEVDLYNGTEQEFHNFLAREEKEHCADLKGRTLPMFPTVTGKNLPNEGHRLLPGMYGKMQLVLRKFKNAYLLPSNAIVSEGGRSYIFEEKNGAAHLVPVEVQVDDGKLAKVVVITKVGKEEVKRDLTGDESVIISNQGELSDGQAVRPSQVDW
jgi:multidrug efflux pump subunit AcrA (membrane-fusion protein)